MNTLVYDYTARQKVGGVYLDFFMVEQVPALPPDRDEYRCPWAPRETLE